MNIRSAISHIEKNGVLLVFPIKNKKAPLSLWACFYPRKVMRWEWDEDGDGDVFDLWNLREKLSASGKVVYAKWYQGRATLFSKKVFTLFLAVLKDSLEISSEASRMLQVLSDNAPISTKALKQELSLVGRAHEKDYHAGLKELWTRLLIVGYGEVDEGSLPSLAMGASSVLFEEEWKAAQKMNSAKALAELEKILTKQSPFFQHLLKLKTSFQVSKLKTLKQVSNKIPKEVSWEGL